MKRTRIKALLLITIAGAMLVFEAACVWGALSVSRRTPNRAELRRIRVIAESVARVADSRVCAAR